MSVAGPLLVIIIEAKSIIALGSFISVHTRFT
jgi:hypothetical protein